MGRIRTAIVGTGSIADFHVRAIREVEGVELAAVCDANVRRAQSFAKSLTSMLRDTHIDCMS